MLEITATNDKELLNSLSINIFGQKFESGVGYVLLENGQAAGLADIFCSEERAVLKSVGIILSKRGKGLGDFFTRSLMLRLSDVSDTIVIPYIDSYYDKFGFMKNNSRMEIDSDKLVFPRACKGE